MTSRSVTLKKFRSSRYLKWPNSWKTSGENDYFPSRWRVCTIHFLLKKTKQQMMFFLEHFVFVFITQPNHQPACATLILLPSNRGQKIACHCGQSGLTAQSVVVLMQGWLLHSSFLFSFFIVFRRLPKFEGRIFVSLENAVARPKGVPQSDLEEIIYFRTGPAVWTLRHPLTADLILMTVGEFLPV